MAKQKFQTDWWKVAGCAWVGVGLLSIIVYLLRGRFLGYGFFLLGMATTVLNMSVLELYPMPVSFVLNGALDVLLGVGLLSKSRIMFWATLLLMVLDIVLGMKFLASFGTAVLWLIVVWVVLLVPMIMLWQQIRNEKGKK